MVVAKLMIGGRYRATSHGAFRRNAPFTVLSICPVRAGMWDTIKYQYVVRYDDGVLDCFPVKNEGGYGVIEDASR